MNSRIFVSYFFRSRTWGRIAFLALVVAILSPSRSAWGVLIPAVGPGTGVGRIEHAVYNTAPAGAGAVFDGFFSPFTADGGDMIAPGFFYPQIGGAAIFQNDTGALPLTANVPVFLQTPPNIPSGFGGAATRFRGVGGLGRAGLLADTFTLFDTNIDPRASVNLFGASVEYRNFGALFNQRFGHFISGRASVDLGGFVAAGVKSIFEVDVQGLTGPLFGSDFFVEPLPLIMVFDGAGPRADFLQTNPLFSRFIVNGQTLAFSMAGPTLPVNIPHGATVRMRSTVSLFADPGASLEFDDVPYEFFSAFELGAGFAANAEDYFGVPEPSSGLLSFALLGMLAGRRVSRRMRVHTRVARTLATT